MAEGSDPLFTNFRTGEQMTVASGIVTASLASNFVLKSGDTMTGFLNVPGLGISKIAGDVDLLGGRLFIANPVTTSLSGPNTVIDMFNDQLRFFDNGGSFRGAFLPITSLGTNVSQRILTSADLSASVLYNNVSLTGNSTVFSISDWVKRIQFFVFSCGSNVANDYPSIQISFNNASTFIVSNYFATGYDWIASVGRSQTNAIISMLTSATATAGTTWTFFGDIDGIALGPLKTSRFTGGADGGANNFYYGGAGFYVGNASRVTDIRIILSTATSSFDAGTISIIGFR